MNRRSFVKKVLNGTIAGSLYLVWPMGSGSLEISEQISEQIPGIRDKEYDILNQEFALNYILKIYLL